MAATVIERLSTTVQNGFIIHDDRPRSYTDAESIFGASLDRRKSYAIIDGEVHELVSWTSACSGCENDSEGVISKRGAGCDECGWTGRRKRQHWVPLSEPIAA